MQEKTQDKFETMREDARSLSKQLTKLWKPVDAVQVLAMVVVAVWRMSAEDITKEGFSKFFTIFETECIRFVHQQMGASIVTPIKPAIVH